MNEFLQVFIGVVFGAGAGYLLATIERIRKRKPRVIAARAALASIVEEIEQRTPGCVDVQAFASVRTLTQYVTDDFCSVHTRDELQLELGAMPERAQ